VTLKEQLAAEAVIFLNPAEFGEEMMVDGSPVLGCWDDEVQPAPRFFGATMDALGINTVERLLFLRPNPSDPLPLPVPDQEMDIGGARWLVRDARPESGIFKLTVYRNEC
jgi:hypothetical protein